MFLLTEYQEHEILSFPLLLLPQRTGHLLYPSVDITVSGRQDASNNVGANGDAGRPPYTSEMDYRNQGDTILVVSDLHSTTVSINLEDPVSGAWLLESKLKSDT